MPQDSPPPQGPSSDQEFSVAVGSHSPWSLGTTQDTIITSSCPVQPCRSLFFSLRPSSQTDPSLPTSAPAHLDAPQASGPRCQSHCRCGIPAASLDTCHSQPALRGPALGGGDDFLHFLRMTLCISQLCIPRAWPG